jgi:MoaE-MoaD fusion protein
MRVRVLLFASHREVLGEGRLELDAPEDATPEDVYKLLEERSPALTSLRPFTTFAVNREVVPSTSPLAPGDEIALLQPVSGG